VADRGEASIQKIIKSKWGSGIVSLLIGLLLGTTVGGDLLDSAGVPKSCVHAIQRADRALDAGKQATSNGKAALAAAKGVRVRTAVDLLQEAVHDTQRLLQLTDRFNDARQRCDKDRKK